MGIIGFADDTTVYTSGNTKEEVIQNLETISLQVLKYLSSNQLVVNTDKTKFLMIHPNRKQDNASEPSKITVGKIGRVKPKVDSDI